MTLVICARIEN